MITKHSFVQKTSIAFTIAIFLAVTSLSVFQPVAAKAANLGDNCNLSGLDGTIVGVSPEVCEVDPNFGTFVVPAGVTSVDVLVVGGGGGGANRPWADPLTTTLENPVFSGGGGGGEVKICTGVSVTPAETLTVTDGAAGTSIPVWNGPNGPAGPNGGQYSLGLDGRDGAVSSLARATTILCSANPGKGGRGGSGASGTRGYGGDSGSGKIGGQGAFASAKLTPVWEYASAGGAGALSDGQPGTLSEGIYVAGSGGHGLAPSTLATADAGFFKTDTTIYGVGGPGGGISAQTGQGQWGADVDGQTEGVLNTAGSGGRGFGAYSDNAMGGRAGVVKFRFLIPASTKTVTIATSTGNGLGSVDIGTSTKNPGETFTSIATASAGSVFAGWTCTPSSYSTANATLTFTVSEDVSCAPTFTLIPPATISFSPGAGTGSAPSSSTGPLLMPGIGSMIAPSGQAFGGWSCTPSGGLPVLVAAGSTYNPGVDTSCVAVWNTIPTTSAPTAPLHYVKFHPNGGYGTTSEIGSNSPAPLSPNWFKNPGHVFTSWNTKANGSGTNYADGATYSFEADANLYAQWSMVKSKKLITTFAGDKPTLKALMKATISKWVKRLPQGATILCQGSTSGKKITAFDKKLAFNRATNVCKYALTVRSDLKYTITLNPSSATKVAARHVWMYFN